MRLLTTAILICGGISMAGADTINLRSGDVVEGTYLGGTSRQVRIDVNGTVQTYDIGQVRSVSFSEPNYQQAPPPPPPPQDTRFREERDTRSAGGVIPADTSITVRMIEAVNSQTARLGQTFRASVDEPVTIDGRQLIPRGADVVTKLVDDKQSGKLEGRTVLTLALVSINVNGQPIDVTSSDVKTESASRGSRTAKVVGGTTALGAIVGALAGGGKGAAIGAASGAAVGGGAEVLTNGQQVKIPSETRLTFRIQSPVQLP